MTTLDRRVYGAAAVLMVPAAFLLGRRLILALTDWLDREIGKMSEAKWD